MKKCKDCSKSISVGSKTGYCGKCSRVHFPVWNKGKTKEELSQLSNSGAKIGNTPYNKNKHMKLQQKIKLSCINRSINILDFDDFTMKQSKRERCKFDNSGLKNKCFQLANFKCDITGKFGGKLNAHHLNGWNKFIDQRFELDNLVCLSEEIHKEFHIKYGCKNNTLEQYQEFKKAKLEEFSLFKNN